MKLSIIIATLNCKKDLELTLESIFQQNVPDTDYEVLVIDGGSTDGTVDLIRSYASTLRYVSEKDDGIYDAMNKGMRLAQGDYLQFLNAGDIFYDNDVLQIVFERLDGKTSIVFGDIHVVNAAYETIFHVRYSTFDLEALKTKGTGTCNHQAFFVKKNIVPMFSNKYMLKAELNWFIDLAMLDSLTASHIDRPLVRYVLGGKGYICFWQNLFEWVCIVQTRFGLWQNIKNIKAYYRFFRYRFYTSKKYAR